MYTYLEKEIKEAFVKYRQDLVVFHSYLLESVIRHRISVLIASGTDVSS